MSKSIREYIRHILDEITFLETESNNYAESQFMHDELRQRAFARSLEVIGEAIKLIPDETRAQDTSVNWKSFAGLRDKLIHHYFGVDYAIVWDVIKNELPTLKRSLEHILTQIA